MQEGPLKNNVTGYSLFLKLETILREFIIDELETISGGSRKIYKERLDGDTYKKLIDGHKSDGIKVFKTRLTTHPIYYIDFSSLSITIERRDNWNDCFKEHIKNKQELVALKSVEAVRNAIAHNRPISTKQIETVKGTLNRFSDLIGKDRTQRYLEHPTIEDLSSIFERLGLKLETINNEILKGTPDVDTTELRQLNNNWWFKDELFDGDMTCLEEVIEFTTWYHNLPRQRGDLHTVLTEYDKRDMKSHFNDAILLLDTELRNTYG